MTASRTVILCLSDIEDFESLTARMPTADECTAIPGLSAEVPVLVMRRAGRDQLYPAELITVTLDTTPAPDPDGMRETVRAVLHHVAEDISNSAEDLTWLARSLKGSGARRDPGDVLAELRKRRADEAAGAETLKYGGSPET